MTNEAISSVLDFFYNEALTASADQLLRSIDDVRSLLSRAPAVPGTTEEFDLMPCVGEILEILAARANRIEMDAPLSSLLMTQDRRAVERMLMRVLDSALKLAEASEASLSLKISGGENGVNLALTLSETDLAVRIARWLNGDPDRVRLGEPDDVPLGIAFMVAGKRLRTLGGDARLDGATVSLDLPSQARARTSALNILVAEDNDESFVLTEMVLENEHVWRARDGQDALEMIQNQRFDVVFMDVHMPGMNGYEVIRSMRDWETRTGSVRTPLVVLSSDDVETQQRSAAEFGCSGFLKKPMEKWEVMPLLERLK